MRTRAASRQREWSDEAVTATGAERLRLFAPGSLETLQRLDAFGCMVLHALEGDYTVAWRLDDLSKHLEAVSLA
jgi:hypothetical protein